MRSAVTERFPGIRYGLIGGVSLVILALIGMVEAFNQREIVADVISMGQMLLLASAAFIAGMAANRAGGGRRGLLAGAMAGLVMSVALVLLVLLGQAVNMRQVFINASPGLFQILVFQQEELGSGIGLLLLSGLLAGAAAGGLRMLPERARRILTTAIATIVAFGMLQDTLSPVFSEWGPLADITDLLFSGNGLSVSGAAGLFVLVVLGRGAWALKGGAVRARVAALPPPSRRRLHLAGWLAGVFVLLILPQILGLFLSEVLTIIGLYIMLGLGLNIIIGFSGMLDLGHVAYFAIGSYTVAILTSP